MAKLIKEVGSGTCAYGNAFYIEDIAGNIIVVPDSVLDEVVAAIGVHKEAQDEKSN